MYSVQSIPVTNEQTVLQDATLETRQRLAEKLAYKWMLPEHKNCTLFDVVGRQLVKQKSPPAAPPASSSLKSGFERAKTQLARIDAHLYSFFITSVFVATIAIPSDFDERFGNETEMYCLEDYQNICCRQCNDSVKDVTLLYMLHCVVLEGTNTYFNNIVDYICASCAVDVCIDEIENATDQLSAEKWQNTMQTLKEKIENGTVCVYTDDFHRVLALMSGAVGYQVGNMQEVVNLYLQEQFAAQQIDRMYRNKSVADCCSVDPFLCCIVCSRSVHQSQTVTDNVGVLSTMYYNTNRIVTLPYFVCDGCKKRWQNNAFASQRFSRLLLLHRDGMRHCYKQALRNFQCAPLEVLGLDYVDFSGANAGEWEEFCKKFFNRYANGQDYEPSKVETKETTAAAQQPAEKKPSAISFLLNTVERDTLNKIFHLIRIEEQAAEACDVLCEAHTDPCIKSLGVCVRKCVCKECIVKNLAFIEILKFYQYARIEQTDAAFDELNSVVDEFSAICDPTSFAKKSAVLNKRRKKQRRNRSCQNKTASDESSTCLQTQKDEAAFKDWRLSKKLPRNQTLHCTHKFNSTLLVNETLEEFYDTNAFNMSPMF